MGTYGRGKVDPLKIQTSGTSNKHTRLSSGIRPMNSGTILPRPLEGSGYMPAV